MAHKITETGTFEVVKSENDAGEPVAEIHLGGFVIESEDGLTRQTLGAGAANFIVPAIEGEDLDETVERFLSQEHWDGLTLHDLSTAAKAS